jgi:hypothetical protein
MFPEGMYNNYNLLWLYDYEGSMIDMEGLGLLGLKLQIPSPSYNTITQGIDGRGGITVMDRLLEPRKLSAQFITMADDYTDSLNLRNSLYRVLGNGKPFYIVESKISSKRWKVYLDEWTPERQNIKVHTFEIPLLTENGFSESITTHTSAYGTSSFEFNNAGDITIDPRIHSEAQIQFSGASTNLVIRNNSTGDEWSLTGTTTSGDTILLIGVKTLKNGVSIFGQTNKKLLTIAPGSNDFELVGASGGFTLTITTRFYFL